MILMRRLLTLASIALSLGVFPSSAGASPITFTGRDVGVSYGGPFPNSDAAHASFLAAISTPTEITQTIDFESAPLGAFTSLVVGNGVTAGFTNQDPTSGISNQNPSGIGTWDTTRPGSQYVYVLTPFVSLPNTVTTTLSFTFATPIDSFGAYISGLGNDAPFGYQFDDGTGQVSLASSGLSNGFAETQFFGFTDFGHTITSVAISLTEVPPVPQQNWHYAIGVDDVTVSTPVPEPASLVLVCTGLGVLARRRRKNASTI
jgi:hypothetical protein